jgi:hypothetical protein
LRLLVVVVINRCSQATARIDLITTERRCTHKRLQHALPGFVPVLSASFQYAQKNSAFADCNHPNFVTKDLQSGRFNCQARGRSLSPHAIRKHYRRQQSSRIASGLQGEIRVNVLREKKP